MSIVKDLPKKNKKNSTSAMDVIGQWLDEAGGKSNRRNYAREALAWCRRLPKLADELPAKTWQRLFEHLVRAAIDATAITPDEAVNDDPVAWQLLAGELPLALACFFPKIKECHRLLPLARKSLSAGLTELLDDQGFLHAKHVDDIRPLMALWIRCLALGDRWKRGCWNAEADEQFHRFVGSALRLTRGDGSSVFGEQTADRDAVALLSTAVAMTADATNRRLASLLFDAEPKKPKNDKTERKSQKASARKLPEPAAHSEWAAIAQLRPSWEPSSPRLSVLFPGQTCRIEVARNNNDVLLSGDWAFEVHIDGAAMTPVGEWSENCWVSDEDGDYLELEMELTENIRVQRHFFFARQDGFLFLADSVLGARFASLDYCGRLPLGRHKTFRRAAETHDGMLLDRKDRALCMPLALPEWIADASAGSNGSLESVAATDNKDDRLSLELRQSLLGSGLMAPLFIDLERRRFNKPFTWRRLTVAESLKAVPPEKAVGYRVAAGDQQWLFYRSLTPPRNRTVLGHNLSTEMLIARFTPEGEIEPLLEIE